MIARGCASADPLLCVPASAGTSSALFLHFASLRSGRLRAAVRPCGPSVGGPDHRDPQCEAL